MNDNAHFETVFTTFPLLHFGMIVAALSYNFCGNDEFHQA